MSETDTASETGKDAFGLTRIETRDLERVLVRLRESQVTTAAWRLDLTSDQGAGGVVRVEVSAGQTVYRGDGVLLGWSQEQLAELYETLTRPADGGGSSFELMQLG